MMLIEPVFIILSTFIMCSSRNCSHSWGVYVHRHTYSRILNGSELEMEIFTYPVKYVRIDFCHSRDYRARRL